MALNLGTIDINDQEIARFIQTQNIDEIKALFVRFLKNQIAPNSTSGDLEHRLKNLKTINPQKSQRVREALDSLNQKLAPLRDSDIKQRKENYLQEKFSR
jgi:hypothetical protein